MLHSKHEQYLFYRLDQHLHQFLLFLLRAEAEVGEGLWQHLHQFRLCLLRAEPEVGVGGARAGLRLQTVKGLDVE